MGPGGIHQPGRAVLQSGPEKQMGKTVRMVFRTYQAAGMQSKETYDKQMTGAGNSYWERQQVQVQCMECGE